MRCDLVESEYKREGNLDGTSDRFLVCLSLTSDLEFAAGVTILNFIEVHASKDFDFQIFSDSDLFTLQRVVRAKGASIRVTRYKPPVAFLKLWGSRAIGQFSPLVLAKFEAFNMLSSYGAILWLDYDIVILEPVITLLKEQDYDFAFMGSGQPASNGFLKNSDPVLAEQEGMSAGIFYLKNSFPGHANASERLYELFESNSWNLFYPEQAIFDLFIRERKFRYRRLDQEVFCSHPEQSSSKASILHSWGQRKFWNGLTNTIWNRYYQEWVDLGGSRYSMAISRLKKASRLFLFSFARLLSIFSART